MMSDQSTIDTTTTRELVPEVALPRGVSRAAGIISGLLLTAGVLGLALHNLGNHYFWSDESSAFFTSLGWPGPGGEPGDLGAIWSTLITFLDPGLFQLLTRAWFEIFGSAMPTLRSLPFTFFVLYLIGILAWMRLIRAPWFLAIGGTAVMMLDNITPYYSVEVRPYSASLAAAVALPLFALHLIHRPSWGRFALYLLVFGVLASMQYNSATVDFACAAIFGLAALVARERRAPLVVAGVVSVLWLPLIYVLTRGNPLTDKSSTLSYIEDTLLRFQSSQQIFHTLFTNLLSWTALPRTVFLVLVPILWASGRMALPWKGGRSRASVIGWLWVFVLSALIIAAALSILGYLPWVVGTRWSITDIGYIALSLTGLTGLLLETGLTRRTFVAWGVLFASLSLTVVGAARLWTYARPMNVSYMTAFADPILSGRPGGTLIDYWIYPDARYWMEYSGEHDAFRSQWIAHRPNSTPGFTAAGSTEIKTFLDSEADRLLMRSGRALAATGLEIPPSVSVVSVGPELLNGVDPLDTPVLLVKNR
jgi:hypothetical protein